MTAQSSTGLMGYLVANGQLSPLVETQFHPLGQPLPRDAMAEVSVAPFLALLLTDDLTWPTTPAQAMASVGLVQGAAVLGTSLEGDPVVVIGGAVAPADLDLSLEAVMVELDGAITDSATGAAVFGHPSLALARAVETAVGQMIEAGTLVLVGPLTAPVAPAPTGSVALHFSTVGTIFLNGGTPPA